MSESPLIQGLRRGEESAARDLLARFQRPLVQYFRVSLPDPQTAEDAAQEVFLRLLGALRGEKLGVVRSCEALVFTIARRLALDMKKSWGRRPRLESLDAPRGGNPEDTPVPLHESVADDAEDAREQASTRERRALVEAALMKLDPETREIIVLRHMEGLSTREVAQIVGVAEGTVWSRLHRGLERLKSELTAAPRAGAKGA